MKDKRNSLIEEIIDSQQVPDMVYTPVKKRHAKTAERVGLDVPEFVLPKTRAEVVEEAEQRLKTIDNRELVKKARERNEVVKRISNEQTGTDIKTVNIPTVESAKTISPTDGLHNDERRSGERNTVTVDIQTRMKERNNLKRVKTEKYVGNPDEFMPFAWRYPLKNEKIKRTSKFFRVLLMEEDERSKFLPINAEDNKSN